MKKKRDCHCQLPLHLMSVGSQGICHDSTVAFRWHTAPRPKLLELLPLVCSSRERESALFLGCDGRADGAMDCLGWSFSDMELGTEVVKGSATETPLEWRSWAACQHCYQHRHNTPLPLGVESSPLVFPSLSHSPKSHLRWHTQRPHTHTPGNAQLPFRTTTFYITKHILYFLQ